MNPDLTPSDDFDDETKILGMKSSEGEYIKFVK